MVLILNVILNTLWGGGKSYHNREAKGEEVVFQSVAAFVSDHASEFVLQHTYWLDSVLRPGQYS